MEDNDQYNNEFEDEISEYIRLYVRGEDSDNQEASSQPEDVQNQVDPEPEQDRSNQEESDNQEAVKETDNQSENTEDIIEEISIPDREIEKEIEASRLEVAKELPDVEIITEEPEIVEKEIEQDTKKLSDSNIKISHAPDLPEKKTIAELEAEAKNEIDVEAIETENTMLDEMLDHADTVEKDIDIESNAVKPKTPKKRLGIKDRKKKDKLDLDKNVAKREKQRKAREKRRAKRLKKQQKREQRSKFLSNLKQSKSKKEQASEQKKLKKERDKERKAQIKKADRERKLKQKKLEADRKAREKKDKDKAPNPIVMRFKSYQRKQSQKLRKDIVGLDIGSSTLRASLIKENEPVEIKTWHLPPGIIVNGILEEPEELTNEIKKFWKHEQIDSKKVNFSFKNKNSLMKLKETAAREAQTIQQVVANDAPRLISPFDPDESILDYTELTESGDKTRLQVGVADKRMAKRFARALERGGLIASACEIGPLASARSIYNPRYPKQGHILIDIGAETSSVLLVSGTDVFYMRIIETGGNDFTEELLKHQTVDWDHGEKLKMSLDINQQAQPDMIETVQGLQRLADRFGQEIARTITQAESETGRPAKSITFIGGGSKQKGLIERLMLSLNNLDIVDPILRPDFEYPDPKDNSTVTALAKGQAMSLLPPPDAFTSNITIPGLRSRSRLNVEKSRKSGAKVAESQVSKHATNPKLIAGLAVVILAAGLNFSNSGIQKEQKDVDEKISNLEQQISSLEGSPVPVSYPNSIPASKVAMALSRQPGGNSVVSVVNIVVGAGGKDIQISTQGSKFTIRSKFKQDATEDLTAQFESGLSNGATAAPTYNAEKKIMEIEVSSLPQVESKESSQTTESAPVS